MHESKDNKGREILRYAIHVVIVFVIETPSCRGRIRQNLDVAPVEGHELVYF